MLALSSRPALALKAGRQRTTLRSSAPSLPGRRALHVVSFLGTRRDESNIADDLKRGGRKTAVRGRQAAEKTKDNLKRSGRQINKGLRSQDFEEPVANNSTIYALNSVALATFAGLAAYNPDLTAGIFFQPSFLMSADTAGPSLLGPLFQILSLGLSAAAVANYVQSGGAAIDELDSTLHKRINAGLSTFSGDLVWQGHVPLRIMEEKGLGFDAVKGEAVSSHADNTSSSSSSSGTDGSAGRRSAVKERALKAFETFPSPFTDIIKATPPEAITEHGLYQRTPDQIPDDKWGEGMVTLVGDAAHTAYVDGTGLALSLEDAAVLGWHVQQQGLTEAALRAFEAERIPRVKEIFSLTDKHAAKMREGVPQRELLAERAELLYGKAKFKPLKEMAAATVQ